MRRPDPLPSWDDLVALGREHGLEHLGVAPADVLARARHALHARKAAGLHAGMGFTYRNPDRSTDPQRAVAGARSIIVGARPYRLADEPERPTEGAWGSVARYAWSDHYAPLRNGLQAIARRLRRSDHRAVVFADDNSIVDREAAYQGGLGWFGKNANILIPGAGSFFVLGSVVTTAEYPASELVADGCGACRRCIDACPTGAIVEPGVIDANRCLAWLVQRPGSFPVEYRTALGDRLYGCDDCQTACPISVRRGPRVAGQSPQAWVDVLDLLDADDAAVLERHGRWYLADRDPRWLRRNALVVLGNIGDPTDRRTAVTLARYADGTDEMLREHARWSQQRLAQRRTRDIALMGPYG